MTMEEMDRETENSEQAFFRIPGSQFGVWRRKPCAQCFYRRTVVVFNNNMTMCHYLLDTGEKRECSPYDCVRMGRFLPRGDGKKKSWGGTFSVREMPHQNVSLLEGARRIGQKRKGE